MTRTLATIAIFAAGLCIAGGTRSEALTPDEPQKQDVKVKAEQPPLKLPTRKEAMQMKLKSAQSILEGIALDDFGKIETAANDMIAVSNATAFLDIYKGKEYQFHVELMRRPAEAIAKKAKEKNIDGVMVAYQDLTLSCLKCHQAMKDKKFVTLER